MVFEQRIPIRYRDTDALGHVNYAVYLTYVEELLLHWLGPIFGDDFVMAHIELNFRAELRYTDTEVVARATLKAIGTSSVTATVAIESVDGAPALDGRLVVVVWDPAARTSRKVSDDERTALDARTSP